MLAAPHLCEAQKCQLHALLTKLQAAHVSNNVSLVFVL